jgi:hypothetical protein
VLEVAAADAAEEPAVAGNVAEEVQIQEVEHRIVVDVEPFAMSAAFVAHSSGSSVAGAWNPIGAVAAAVVVRGDIARVAVAVA